MWVPNCYFYSVINLTSYLGIFVITFLVTLPFTFESNMTDLSTIRVIPFCGKSDEWPICSEKFLAKAKRYGFKDVLIGKLSIPKADEEFDEDSVTGKKMKNANKVNKLAYTELLLQLMSRPVLERLRSTL
jgi:hypothetical protein